MNRIKRLKLAWVGAAIGQPFNFILNGWEYGLLIMLATIALIFFIDFIVEVFID